MANSAHIAVIEKGVAAWNEWRRVNPTVIPDLSDHFLIGEHLGRIDLSNSNLKETHFSKSDLLDANFRNASLYHAQFVHSRLTSACFVGADLRRANFGEANLTAVYFDGADLSRAVLSDAKVSGATFTGAILQETLLGHLDLSHINFRGADLTGADLQRALLMGTNFEGATLSGCRVYGTSVWDVPLERAAQRNLVITPWDQPAIEVDNLEVAQFIYLLLNNQRIRDVIDTITSKVVLILGRFTPERKCVLEAIREALRKSGRLPVLFDFDKPASQTTEETIATLAHMARFVVADLTDAKSVLQELRSIVPNSPSVVVQPIILASQEEPGMFDFFLKFPWVLQLSPYSDAEALIAELDAKVVGPAERKANELASRR